MLLFCACDLFEAPICWLKLTTTNKPTNALIIIIMIIAMFISNRRETGLPSGMRDIAVMRHKLLNPVGDLIRARPEAVGLITCSRKWAVGCKRWLFVAAFNLRQHLHSLLANKLQYQTFIPI